MQRPGQHRAPGIFKWAYYLGSSYSNIRLPSLSPSCFPLLPPSDHRRFIMKASPCATSEDRCRRFSRYPWLLLCLSEETRKGKGILMRHASWDLRDVRDLPPICLKDSIYRSTENRCINSLLASKSFNGFCQSADKCESRV